LRFCGFYSRRLTLKGRLSLLLPLLLLFLILLLMPWALAAMGLAWSGAATVMRSTLVLPRRCILV
jgi:hypothetical protein